MSVEDMEQYKRGPYNFAIQYAGITTAQLDRWQKAGVFVTCDARGLIYGYPYPAKIGIKDGEYYIAESDSLIDVRVQIANKDKLIASAFNYWVDMDEFYGYNDGKMNKFWN